MRWTRTKEVILGTQRFNTGTCITYCRPSRGAVPLSLDPDMHGNGITSLAERQLRNMRGVPAPDRTCIRGYPKQPYLAWEAYQEGGLCELPAAESDAGRGD